MTLLDHRRRLEETHRILNESTSYRDGYLVTGVACDSSPLAAFRMEYVKRAEAIFIIDHKQEILKMAAKLVEDELEEAGCY